MIWNKEMECMSRAGMQELQLERLKWSFNWAYENVERNHRAFDAAGVKASDIKSLDDIRRLPFMIKDELRTHYPYGLFAVPLKKVVRIHASSGTTGKPIVAGYSRRDMETWTELIARLATAAGVTDEDVAQISFGYGLFTGAFGLHQGLERIGATVVPISAGNTERQITLMHDFEVTALIATPSYALYIAEALRESGIPRHEFKLRLGLFGAEPWSENMRRDIESKMGISATDNYGLTEIMGPGVSGECAYKSGLHIAEDHFLLEVLNTETGEPAREGEIGEVVITNLTKEAFPVVRYRTRDLASITYEPCQCGRTTARMSRVKARTDDMLIIRGVNVFPSQVETVLLEVEGCEPHYQIIVTRNGALDEMEVKVEVSENIFFDQMKELRRIQDELSRKLERILQIKAKIHLVEPKSIERSAGKAKRVIDKRVM